MIHWTCDRCGSAVEGEPMTLLIVATLHGRPVETHLCGPCRESFGAWISAAKPIKPKPETEPAKEAPDGGG